MVWYRTLYTQNGSGKTAPLGRKDQKREGGRLRPTAVWCGCAGRIRKKNINKQKAGRASCQRRATRLRSRPSSSVSIASCVCWFWCEPRVDRVRRRLDPAPGPTPTPAPTPAAPGGAEAGSSVSTIIACRRLAPADTLSGIGIERVVSIGPGEDGSGGNAVNVKGESGESGNGWMGTAAIGVAVAAGFSFACRGEARARACALGPRVGYGGADVAVGREGGVEGRVFGAAVMVCDSFDGGRGPCVRQGIVSFWQRLN